MDNYSYHLHRGSFGGFRVKRYGRLPQYVVAKITLDPTGGARLGDVIDDAIKMAKHFRVKVAFVFNGTELEVGARSKPDKIWEIFQKKRGQ